MLCRVVAVVLALTGAAAAAPRTVQLGYTGDACGADEIVARVRELAGRDPFAPDAALHVTVTAHGTNATVAITDGGAPLGARALVASSCSELADAVALVIAMSLERPEPAPPPSPLPPSPRPPRTIDREEPPVALVDDARAPTRLAVMAGLATDAGGTPAATVAVRARRARWSGELGFEAQLPATHEMVEIVRGAGTVAGCAHAGPFAACGLAEVGWVTGRGRRLVTATTATTPIAAAGLRITAERGLGHGLALRARLDGRLVVTSTSFTVDDEAVWTTPRAEAWLGIDLLAHIP